jgi:hypothetical protein
MSSSSAPLSTLEGPGSVSGAPNLPAGFTDTFTSRFIDAGGLRQHAVIGGDGPPLLLVHGWPENRYAWRPLMLSTASAHARSARRTGSPTALACCRLCPSHPRNQTRGKPPIAA